MGKRKDASIYRRCPRCGKQTMRKGARTVSGKRRWRCQVGAGDRLICYQTTDPTAPYRGHDRPKNADIKEEFDQDVGEKKRLVLTWAQNATPIHVGFLRALQQYCTVNDATLLVIPGRYKNPTSRWEASQVNAQWWAPEIVAYLVNQRKKLNKNLMLLADIHVQPTAVTPLSGFETITHGESGILGHPKLQFRAVPTPQNKTAKILTTTGAVTIQNYSDTRAGKKGEFHHVLGAAVIELEDTGAFHLRQINARKDGAFCELDKAYYPDGKVRPAGPYPALVFGDTHWRFVDAGVVRATFKKGGLVDRLNPSTLVWHDLLDSYAVNVHHPGHPFIAVAKRKSKVDNMAEEVEETVKWMLARSEGREAVIVPSNHDNMLYRWLERTDWRDDPENAAFYLETAQHLVNQSRVGDQGFETEDPFHYWIKKIQKRGVVTFPRNGSLTIKGIECALHGHQGPHGARGTLKNLSRIGAKVISGHSHSPGIEAGHYKTGTMTPLALEYTGPVGGWLNTHCSIDPMGKRHLHTCVDEKFWS